MNKLIIKNGLVYDPFNKIEGEKKDILAESGKIVDKFSNENDIKEIDANGKTVIPSAIDIHTHIASQQVNWMRLLGSSNDTFNKVWHGLTLENIAKNYISMGYTFILEANVFPSLAKQTIFNFQQIPVLDKGMLLNISNLWPLELEFQRGKIEDMAVFLSDLLSKTKGFGFKVYNPFECEVWNFKELREDISKQGRLYNFSAMDVYKNVVKCVEFLGLPHSAHAHIEGYENAIGIENLYKVLEQVKSLELEPNPKINSKIRRAQVLHLAHLNSYSIDGDNTKIISILNENPYFSADLSFVSFNQINPMITSDRRLVNTMFNMDSIDSSYKLISSSVEFEGDSFVSMRTLDKNSYQDCILWANALDLALNTSNQSQMCFSLNFPNYSNITDIPEIATWLVSKEARDKFMKEMNSEFVRNSNLKDINRVLNFNEFLQLTRVNPARSLGIGSIKGNLGVGADADINILDLNLREIEISSEYIEFKKALSNIDYVIKSGEIVKKQQNFNLNSRGSIFWTKGKPEVEEKDFILTKKKEFYQKYSSLFYDSYQVFADNNLLRELK
ncbi:MAG: amidohydrolase family protein [Candidatus Lokiarchaeota archaeon]|nr:amidohydrolase family protein [Candidatus Lokiarchaeota archaeon]